MATHLRTELTLEKLEVALRQCQPTDVIYLCDQGTQYTSLAFGQRYKMVGERPSMGSVDDCYDNAHCEDYYNPQQRHSAT